jgi:peptidoglycan/xylan/chitin deacetylase (PgdA/CDA1 family)
MIEKLPLLAWPFRHALTTLIFHRVLPVSDPLRPGEPDPELFDRLMNFLARNFVVLPLVEAVDLLKHGNLPKRACCITFDDGYADNLSIALPILEKYRLPAMVFVATGYLDGGRMFNDTVIDAIAQSRLQRLDLREIDLGMHDIATMEARQDVIAAILQQIKYRPPEQRSSDVARFLELPQCGALPTDIMLTSRQVAELSARGIEIGGHTINHPILTSVQDDVAKHEIIAGKHRLEQITGKPIQTFAYPNGQPNKDYAARHATMVREAGFKLAVSTAQGVGSETSDIFQLPRFTPWGGTLMRKSCQLLKNARRRKEDSAC